MSSTIYSNIDWVDARFERAVDILQSLPRAGAIQTSYDNKLLLYATEGDVSSNRPGVFDVLGRAKWDAWNSRKGLSEGGAKSLYVASLVKILRTFNDRPQAIAHIRDLESFTLEMSDGTDESDVSSPNNNHLPPPQRYRGHDALRPNIPRSSSSNHQTPLESSQRSPRADRRHRPATLLSPPAPSLPGYGPPRTGADSVIGEADYSSDSEEGGLIASSTGNSLHPIPTEIPTRFATPSVMGGQFIVRPSNILQQPRPIQPQQSLQPLFAQYQHYQQIHQTISPPSSSYQAHHQSLLPFPGFSPAPLPGPSSQLAVHYPVDTNRKLAQEVQTRAINSETQTFASERSPEATIQRMAATLVTLQDRLMVLEANRSIPGGATSLIAKILRLAYFQILVLLRFRTPQSTAPKLSLGKLISALVKSFLKSTVRITGDLAALFIVLSVLRKVKGNRGGDISLQLWQILTGITSRYTSAKVLGLDK